MGWRMRCDVAANKQPSSKPVSQSSRPSHRMSAAAAARCCRAAGPRGAGGGCTSGSLLWPPSVCQRLGQGRLQKRRRRSAGGKAGPGRAGESRCARQIAGRWQMQGTVAAEALTHHEYGPAVCQQQPGQQRGGSAHHLAGQVAIEVVCEGGSHKQPGAGGARPGGAGVPGGHKGWHRGDAG